ncbi:MAG: YecA family protein [Thiohalomonadaceae bacterium]
MNAAPDFTEAQADFLHAFLSDPARPSGTMRYEEVAGFLFALSSVADMIPPNEWVPLVFNDQDAGYRDEAEADTFFNALMALHQWVAAGVADKTGALPPRCVPSADPMANFGSEASLGRWARGFVAGHQYMSDWWPAELPQDQGEELSALLVILPFFTSLEFASSYASAMDTGRSFEELTAHILAVYPEALRAYAVLGEIVSPKSEDDGFSGLQ